MEKSRVLIGPFRIDTEIGGLSVYSAGKPAQNAYAESFNGQLRDTSVPDNAVRKWTRSGAREIWAALVCIDLEGYSGVVPHLPKSGACRVCPLPEYAQLHTLGSGGHAEGCGLCQHQRKTKPRRPPATCEKCCSSALASCITNSQHRSGRMNSSDTSMCYVVLHMGSGPSRTVERQSPSPLIVREDRSVFQLSDRIWIERLDPELAINIQSNCDPGYYSAGREREQDRHLYAFVSRALAHEKSLYAGMSDLKGVIALSRLVNPTSTGDRYCAQVHQFPAKDSRIFPLRDVGVSPDVLLPTERRDWLSVADGETLRKLMPLFSSGKQMHKRVHRAYWNLEHAMRSYFLDIRWPLIVSAFEALMNTEEEKVGWQFRERVGQLASDFGASLSDDELKNAYRLRSKLIHAEGFLFDLVTVLPADKHIPLYEKLESLLRTTLLSCLLDQNFGDFFKDAASVERRWPISSKSNGKGRKRNKP